MGFGWIHPRKRPDGSPFIGSDGKPRYDAGYWGNDRKRHKRTFTRKADAQRWLVSEQAKLQRGDWVDPSLGRLRLGDYAVRWLETKEGTSAGNHTKVAGHLRNHIMPTFGPVPLSAIEPADVRSWVRKLSRQGRAPATVKAIYQSFAQIMAMAEVDRLIPRSPCIGVELPRDRNREEMHFLTHDQVQALAEAISWKRRSYGHEGRDERHRALILVAAYTGMRAGELHGLHRRNLDLGSGRIHVVESLAEVPKRVSPNGLLVGPTKTGRPRWIRLPRPIRRVLADHVERFPSPEGFVFPGETGGAVRHGNFYERRFKPAVHRAGLPEDLRFHDLRHTAAAFFIADGFNAKQVMDRLGHSTIKVTYDRYGHLLEGHDDELMDRLEARWDAATTGRLSRLADELGDDEDQGDEDETL